MVRGRRGLRAGGGMASAFTMPPAYPVARATRRASAANGWAVVEGTYNRLVSVRLPPARGAERHPGRGRPPHGGARSSSWPAPAAGKTRALTHRIAYLIREHGVSPAQILAITFTNKAAREMADRVEGLLGGRVAKGMWILTFHSTCARILRREHDHLGVPSGFTIYDDGDTERLIAGVLKDLDLDPKRFPPRAMASAIGRAKDQVLDADEFAQMRRQLLRGDRREGVRRVRAAQARGRRARLRRPDQRDGPAVPRPSRGAARTTRSGSATSWSTSTRTRTARSTSWSTCWREVPQRLRGGRRRPGRVLAGAAPRSRTSWTSSATTPTRRCS